MWSIIVFRYLFSMYQYLYPLISTQDLKDQYSRSNSSKTQSSNAEQVLPNPSHIKLIGWCLDGSIPILCCLRVLCPYCWGVCFGLASWFKSISWTMQVPDMSELPRRFWRISFRQGARTNYGTMSTAYEMV